MSSSVLFAYRRRMTSCQGVVELELSWKFRSQLVQLVPQQDVILRLVRVQKPDLGLVLLVLRDGLDDLVRWGDPGSPADQPDLRELGLLAVNEKVSPSVVRDVSDGPLGLNLVANLHLVEVLGQDSAVRKLGVDPRKVDLDHQVK